MWKPQFTGQGHILNEAYDEHNRTPRLSHKIFKAPHDHVRSRLKTSDQKFASLQGFVGVNLLHATCIGYGIIKYWCICLLRICENINNQMIKMKYFQRSLEISNFNKRNLNQKKNKLIKKMQHLLARTLAFTTMFTTANNLSTFNDRTDFKLGMITTFVDNHATVTVLNNKALFVGDLRKAQWIGVETVGSDNHRPNHVGAAEISIKDDESNIYNILIPNALFFLVSGERPQCRKPKSKFWT